MIIIEIVFIKQSNLDFLTILQNFLFMLHRQCEELQLHIGHLFSTEILVAIYYKNDDKWLIRDGIGNVISELKQTGLRY